MSNSVIKVENVGKLYHLGQVGTGTLSHDINRWWQRIRGNEDPYLKIGETNDRTKKGASEIVWALKDISFEVKQGEVLGLIGKNGAGKSTLLKILSRVTNPTVGEIKVKGRIASLLEVGTGFHPELTGKENIYLNGAILGMSKREIRNKFDEIVDFSGVERYVDTPVKRYSSGMYVRLAFAVAAHLEPEILIVDEVLAVGDSEFQKKCLGKMKDVSGQGRTVLFVSHNMAAIETLCNRAIMIKNGKLVEDGVTKDVITSYIKDNTVINSKKLNERTDRVGGKTFKFASIEFYDSKGNNVDSVISGEYIEIKVGYTSQKAYVNTHLIFGVTFYDNYKEIICSLLSDEMGCTPVVKEGEGHFILQIPKFSLRGGLYSIRLWATEMDTSFDHALDIIEDAHELNVLSGDFWGTGQKNREDYSALMPSQFKFY